MIHSTVGQKLWRKRDSTYTKDQRITNQHAFDGIRPFKPILPSHTLRNIRYILRAASVLLQILLRTGNSSPLPRIEEQNASQGTGDGLVQRAADVHGEGLAGAA
jgi:hypothetical protein